MHEIAGIAGLLVRIREVAGQQSEFYSECILQPLQQRLGQQDKINQNEENSKDSMFSFEMVIFRSSFRKALPQMVWCLEASFSSLVLDYVYAFLVTTMFLYKLILR